MTLNRDPKGNNMSRYRVVQRAVNKFDVEKLEFGVLWIAWPIVFNTLEKAIKFINDRQKDENAKTAKAPPVVVYDTNIQQLPREGEK